MKRMQSFFQKTATLRRSYTVVAAQPLPKITISPIVSPAKFSYSCLHSHNTSEPECDVEDCEQEIKQLYLHRKEDHAETSDARMEYLRRATTDVDLPKPLHYVSIYSPSSMSSDQEDDRTERAECEQSVSSPKDSDLHDAKKTFLTLMGLESDVLQ